MKKNMKKILLLFILTISFGAYSQIQIQNQVLSTSGNSFTDGTYVMDFTFGETFTSSLSTSSMLITQGFQQPKRKKQIAPGPVVSADELNMPGLSVFPNPFNNEITIEISYLEDLYMIIYDNSGREVGQKELNSITTTIDLSELAVGNYQFNLYTLQNELIGRIPVIKTP